MDIGSTQAGSSNTIDKIQMDFIVPLGKAAVTALF
jgi:hypothetical protein